MTDHPTLERAALGQRAVTPSGADVAFADLIYADTGLLHLEFDAIIAANFPVGGGQPSRRPPRQTRPAVAEPPRRPARRQLATTAAGLPWSAPAGGTQMQLSRQRSPPGNNQATEPTAIADRGGDQPPEHSGSATSAHGPVTTIPPNRQSACSPHADRLQRLRGTPRW
jgi:hypothetical protein